MLQALAQSTYNYTTSSSSSNDDIGGGVLAAMGIFVILYIAVVVLMMVSGWKVFQKAGRPGWGALVPYHNFVLALEMAGKPGWWILVPLYSMFVLWIPIVGLFLIIPLVIVFIVYGFIISIAFAKSFGKGTGFGVFLALLAFIALPVLAFGDAKYVGPAQSKPTVPATN